MPKPVAELEEDGTAVAEELDEEEVVLAEELDEEEVVLEEVSEEEVLAAAPLSDILNAMEKLGTSVESMISNANGPSDAAGAYGGVHRYEDPETLAKAGN